MYVQVRHAKQQIRQRLQLTFHVCRPAIKQMNSDFSLGQSAAPAAPAAAACQEALCHWCLDGKHINRGGIIAIIVVGSVLVLAALVAASILAARRRTRKEGKLFCGLSS